MVVVLVRFLVVVFAVVVVGMQFSCSDRVGERGVGRWWVAYERVKRAVFDRLFALEKTSLVARHRFRCRRGSEGVGGDAV